MEKENKNRNILPKHYSKNSFKRQENVPSLVLTSNIPGMGLFVHTKNEIGTTNNNIHNTQNSINNTFNTAKNYKADFKIRGRKQSSRTQLSESNNFKNTDNESLNSEIYEQVNKNQIQLLNKQIMLQNEELEQKNQEIVFVQFENEQLKNDIHMLKKDIEELQNKNFRETNLKTTFEEQYKIKQQEIQRLKTESANQIQKLQKEVQNIKKVKNDNENNKNIYQVEYTKKDSIIQQLQNKYQNVKQENDQLKKLLEQEQLKVIDQQQKSKIKRKYRNKRTIYYAKSNNPTKKYRKQ